MTDWNRRLATAAMSACLAALLLAPFAVPQAAHAQALTTDEAKCRSAIAKATSRHIKAIGKAVIGCHKTRDLAVDLAATDCNDIDQADTAGKVGAAETKLLASIQKACAGTPSVLGEFLRCPTPFEGIDDGGATSGIDDYAELSACLIAQSRLLAEDAAADAMGAPSPPIDEELAKCHATIGKSYTKLINTTFKVRSKCQSAADKAGGPLDFACATADPDGKIVATAGKARKAITAACQEVAALSARSVRAVDTSLLGACGETAEELADCAIDEAAANVADGAAAMAYELPGTCPGAGFYGVSPSQSGTELDVGFRGTAHDMEPILGFRAVNFDVSCDPDCNNCGSGAPSPAPEACRCENDASAVCDTLNGNDADDCAGGMCRCYFGPPTPYVGGGTPACVVSQVADTMTGSFDLGSGEMSLQIPIRGRIHHGLAIQHPCPRCTAGTCRGGARHGLACSVDASDATFGDVSYDCPPNIGSNISGAGVRTTLAYTTGAASLAFTTPCDSPSVADCACALCSTDSSIGCASNADCAAAPSKCSLSSSFTCDNDGDCASVDAGPCNQTFLKCQKKLSQSCSVDSDCLGASVGTCEASSCTATGPGSSRRPNACDDDICTPVPGEPGEGECAAGPDDKFCSGFLRANGKGLIVCGVNGDCASFEVPSPNPEDWVCPGNDCGDCTVEQTRECFLDPIEAAGTPGSRLVGVGCMGATGSSGVNAVLGLPGGFRVRQNFTMEAGLCSDGVTPFIPPGGSNCP